MCNGTGSIATGAWTEPQVDCSNLSKVQVYTVQPTVAARGSLTTTATGSLTLHGLVAGNSVTVGSQVFTAVSASPTSIQFVVGADDSTTATNLAAAINAHPAVSVVVSAVAAASVVNLTAKIAGISGNYLSLGSNLTSAATPSGTSLAGGSGTGKGVITVLGLQFKDLNGDGLLEPYEDWRLLEICRAKDLVSRMTTAQKIGLMSEGALFFSSDSAIPASVMASMSTANVRQGLLRPAFGATQSAVYVNRLNELAESLPLGVPVVVGADPGHATNVGMAASGNLEVSAPTQFTPWPGTLGLGAINDRDLTFQHADMVRQEFQASGIRWQFGPLADIATEPRWYRVGGTFGSNALLAAKHVEQMVSGFQNSLTGNLRNGIAATVMHFPGHGPEWKGMDAHSDFGRYTVYPGNNFEYHLIPFQAAFDAGAAALMPALAIEKLQYDVDPLQVPSAFSYELITLVAKKQMGFRGLVTSDWCTMGPVASAWVAMATTWRASRSPSGPRSTFTPGHTSLATSPPAPTPMLTARGSSRTRTSTRRPPGSSRCR